MSSVLKLDGSFFPPIFNNLQIKFKCSLLAKMEWPWKNLHFMYNTYNMLTCCSYSWGLEAEYCKKRLRMFLKIISKCVLRKTQRWPFRMPFISMTFQDSNTNAYTYISPPKTTFNHYCNKHHRTNRKRVRLAFKLGRGHREPWITCSLISSYMFIDSIQYIHTYKHTQSHIHARTHTELI